MKVIKPIVGVFTTVGAVHKNFLRVFIAQKLTKYAVTSIHNNDIGVLTAHGCNGPSALEVFKFYLGLQKAARKTKAEYKNSEFHGI